MSCKSLIFLVLIFSFFYQASAQKVTVSPEVLLRDDYSFTLLGDVGGKILLLRNKGYAQTLSIYNEGLGFVQEIPLEFEERKINLIGFVTSKNDFNAYYSYRDKGNEYVKSVKLSPNGEKYFQDTLLIRENIYLSEYYKFVGSENDRYVAVFNDLSDSQVHIMLYDNQEMSLIYDVKVEAKGINMRKDFRNIVIDESGKIALLFEKFNSAFRRDGHQYRLLELNTDGAVFDKKIHMKGKMSTDVQLLANKHTKDFEIAGLFSNKYEDVCNGYFVYSGDSLKMKPFSNKMVANLNAGNKNKEDGLQDYMLNDILFRQDGGLILVMESNKEFYRTSNGRSFRGGGYRSSVTDYYNEDIVVISTKPNGDFEWNTVLPKKQFSQDDDGVYSSFFIFKTPSKLRFIYNDEIKKNNTVSEYVLNPAGVFERNSVLSTAYQKLKLRIRNSIQVSNSSFLLTSERNNRLNIVKIEY